MKNRVLTLSLILLVTSVYAAGCAFREEAVRTAVPEIAETPPAETEAAPPGVEVFTVRFFVGEEELCSVSAEVGAPCASPDTECGDVRIIGWTDRDGNAVDLSALTVTDNLELYAVSRPILPGDVHLLEPRESGLIAPHSALTWAELRFGVTALLGNKAAALLADCGVPTEDGEAAPEEARAVLNALFSPEDAAAGWDSTVSAEAVSVTRAEWASLLNGLLPAASAEAGDFYSPDVSPDLPEYAALARFCTAPELTPESLSEQAVDGYLWFDGYLYALGEDGCFLCDTEHNGLLFDADGRYTSTNTELDGYVAQTIREYCQSGLSRRENLKLLYDHVKNDFRYLTRNYYDSGATGWDIQEALTLFSTGKGNCYCYAGVFCYLARGLGYNARTYSGSMGTENQPHAWTEITEEDGIYICDPEIEMNYWYLEMYTDNFMMKKENAGGWNYQSVGRTP